MPAPLASTQIDAALRDLPGWLYKEDKLTKTYQFGDFREAVSFIMRLAFYAEELSHHPELHNVYNRVTVELTTHDAGDKVTEKDVRLARAIEGVAWV